MQSRQQVSRRGFFRHAVGGTAAGAAQVIRVVTGPESPLPRQAWIIMRINWEYNDEYSSQEGEGTCDKVYFDKPAAEVACRALCEAFFRESPEEFGVWWDLYGLDSDTATWDDLLQAGFPHPYYIKELEP
jgi:hypothetical protein